MSPVEGSITLTVSPYSGEKGNQKGLRFTVAGIEINDKTQVYGICKKLSSEECVANVAVYSVSGDVRITIHHWQIITEPLAIRIAKMIGVSLGAAPGDIMIEINRLA